MYLSSSSKCHQVSASIAINNKKLTIIRSKCKVKSAVTFTELHKTVTHRPISSLSLPHLILFATFAHKVLGRLSKTSTRSVCPFFTLPLATYPHFRTRRMRPHGSTVETCDIIISCVFAEQRLATASRLWFWFCFGHCHCAWALFVKSGFFFSNWQFTLRPFFYFSFDVERLSQPFQGYQSKLLFSPACWA